MESIMFADAGNIGFCRAQKSLRDTPSLLLITWMLHFAGRTPCSQQASILIAGWRLSPDPDPCLWSTCVASFILACSASNRHYNFPACRVTFNLHYQTWLAQPKGWIPARKAHTEVLLKQRQKVSIILHVDGIKTMCGTQPTFIHTYAHFIDNSHRIKKSTWTLSR